MDLLRQIAGISTGNDFTEPFYGAMLPGTAALDRLNCPECAALESDAMMESVLMGIMTLLVGLMTGGRGGKGLQGLLENGPGPGGFGSPAAAPGLGNAATGAAPAATGPTAAINNAPVGNGAGGALQWALSQEGVSESRNPDVVRGYSRGNWQAWCADFVSTAFEKSGGSPWGHQSSVQGILDWGKRTPGHFLSTAEARANPGKVRPGDVVIWKQNGRSHTGIVTRVNGDGTFDTVEGNSSDSVRQKRGNRLSSNQLTGFVRAHGTF